MRLKVVKFLYGLFLIGIIFRLGYWQIIRSDDLKVLAEQQHISSHTIEAARGLIFTSDNSMLVSNQPSFTLYGLPKVIADKKQVATALSKYLETEKQTADDGKKRLTQELVEKLSQNLFWVPLSKNLDIKNKEEIEKLGIEGIGFEPSLTRFYPESSSSAHLLGFVAADALGRQAGYFGVEGFYNGELKGIAGQIIEEKDALGLPILIGRFSRREAKKGFNLVLNLDRAVQHIVEKKLKEGIEKYGAKGASAVVLEPKTGAILAMASFPNYDPGHYTDFPKEYFKNPIVADSYEPGSTFKVLVMAAAINEDVVKQDTVCDNCSGPVQVGGFYIRTWNNKYQDKLTVMDTIVHSDNTGMVFVGRKLGLDKFYDYLQKFGFGMTTNIDLQDETSPQIRPREKWKEVDLATASFGQGIAVSAMQMVEAVGAISNGGVMMEPHVVRFIKSDERNVEIKPKVVSIPISSNTAKIITEMMVAAVDKGEAKAFKPKGFRIAGKTGTAQIPVEGHYDPSKTIASFVGFAPADEPKFVMLVRYDQPSSSIYGAETAAPTFFDIAKELFTYYGIAPEE